ncbi:MAG: LysR family transcriptional regulator, partial [Solobacterium sp.]|nr:LysR family transcriptional regulator [Solobacterium sp.]
MTIEQLETFINACKSDSFATPAGFHRYTSSAHEDILALEKEFDTILFLREGKKTGVLTEAGMTLYREALPLVRQYYRTMRMMDLHRMHEDRTVVIGTIPILRQYRLTQLFKRFDEEHEGFNIRFEEVDNRMLMDGMRDNYYDAIITRKTMLDPSLPVNIYPLASDEMAVILSDSHPLAYEPSINIRKLKNED